MRKKRIIINKVESELCIYVDDVGLLVIKINNKGMALDRENLQDLITELDLIKKEVK